MPTAPDLYGARAGLLLLYACDSDEDVCDPAAEMTFILPLLLSSHIKLLETLTCTLSACISRDSDMREMLFPVFSDCSQANSAERSTFQSTRQHTNL